MMKRIIAAAFASFIAISAAVSSLCALAKSEEDISPAIDWLRRNTAIEKSGTRRGSIALDEKDFEKAVGKRIGYVTIIGLPKMNEGRLCLNGVDVIEGQTVTAASLSRLAFVPADGSDGGVFSVKCAADGWNDVVIPCRIAIRDSENGCPTMTAGAFETLSGVCCVAAPKIYDPDDDDTVLQVVRYPENGSVRIVGTKVYYTPFDGYVGSDSMVVEVSDMYGGTSPETELTFNVKRNTYSIRFADMKNDAAHSAAVALAERSVVAFTRRDGEYFFSPADSVSRIDFVVMLLTAAGVNTDTSTPVSLKFDDLDGVPEAKLRYLEKAADMGLIRLTDKSFVPDGGVTRVVAAEWVGKLLGMSVRQPAEFSDMVQFDENERFYAAAAVEAGIMVADGNSFCPDAVMTKSAAAIALKGVMDRCAE